MTISKNFKDIREARKMYDGGRAAKRGWDCGDCGAEKNRSDQCRSCGSPKRYHVKEATAKEVLAKRMKSDHPDDNPQAFRQTKSPIKDGPKTYKMHGKFQDSGRVSQKGKTAALKKQHKRRPKDYGISETPELSSPELQQQLDELSPKTLKNYTNKVLSKTPPHELDDKQIKNIRRAGQKIYDKEYSKTGKPVKDKDGKTVGMVHKEEAPLKGFRNKDYGVSKAGNLHRNPDSGSGQSDSDRVADALDKHEFKKKRLSMIRKAHKKVLKKKGIKEDLASGRPAKKPVSSNLLKQRARDNEKALKSGFMKLTPKERAKEAKRFLEDKNWPRPFSKSERDEFLEKGPKGKHKVSSDTKKTIDQISKDKEDRKKAINKSTRRGRLPESAPAAGDVDKKTMGQINRRIDKEMKKKGIKTNWMKGVKEAKKPTVHFKGGDKLKTVKIKYNKPIKTKVTDIGPGGKEVVRKDWSEEQKRIVESLSKLIDRGIEDKRKERTTQVGQKRAKDGKSLEPVMGKTKAPKHLLVRYGKPEKKR